MPTPEPFVSGQLCALGVAATVHEGLSRVPHACDSIY